METTRSDYRFRKQAYWSPAMPVPACSPFVAWPQENVQGMQGLLPCQNRLPLLCSNQTYAELSGMPPSHVLPSSDIADAELSFMSSASFPPSTSRTACIMQSMAINDKANMWPLPTPCSHSKTEEERYVGQSGPWAPAAASYGDGTCISPEMLMKQGHSPLSILASASAEPRPTPPTESLGYCSVNSGPLYGAHRLDRANESTSSRHEGRAPLPDRAAFQQTSSAHHRVCPKSPRRPNRSNDRHRTELEAARAAKVELIVRLRQEGKSFKEIKQIGEFREPESSLRGLYRQAVKAPEQRVRRPEWSVKDVSCCLSPAEILSDMRQVRLLELAARSLAENGDVVKGKIPWKKVGDFIKDEGGSYHFGNATCKKRWEELVRVEAIGNGKNLGEFFFDVGEYA